LLRTFSGHQGKIWQAAFSPDGRLIATASDDGTLRVWNTKADNEFVTLQGHESPVQCVAFSNDGSTLVSGGANTARLWDVSTGRQKDLERPLQGHAAGIQSVAFSHDDRRVLTGSSDTTAKLWDAKTGKEILTLRGHTRGVTTVAFSPDGKLVLTGGIDGTAILWLTEY
jgi:WD40 repeat protein